MFGFTKVEKTDHEFAAMVRGMTYANNGNSVTWTDSNKQPFAVVFFDNTQLTRDIWIKE